VLTAVLLTAAAGIAQRMIRPARPPCQETLVPAYFYPGLTWSRAIRSHPAPRIMILDITSSGAGSAPDRNYQAEVGRARAAGITLLGYTNTDYTRRPAAAVEADVRHYRSWYGVTGIFLDEVSSDTSGVAYYRRLASYVHTLSPGSIVMLNPGTYPDRQYMAIGDIVMVFENSYASYLRLHVPGWVRSYPAARFAHAIYATSQAQLARAISLSQRRHAGYVYVTGRAGVNPYDALPSYWAREDAVIAAECG
jgi:Spherulation-specific family 4